MRQVLALFTALVFGLGLATSALAQGTTTQPSSPPAGSSSTETKPGTAGKSHPGMEKSATGKPAAGKMAGTRGQHKMMGEVTKIDSTKGMVTLKTDEGDLDLHFPPSALQGIKEGDRVEVQLSIRPAGAGAKAGEPAKTPAPKSSAPGAAKPAEQPKTQ
jgi:cold shock CspA family protein